ncbi:hypothetical protein ACTNDY_13305 [Tissierellaceae bacterium HCP3S3_D8]
MKRKNLALLLVFTLLLVSSIAFAELDINGFSDNIKSIKSVGLDDDSTIVPFGSTVPVNKRLDGEDGSEDIVFYTGPTYPWYRIYIYNNSNVDYKVNITDSHGNNQGIRWIDPHDDIEITNENAANGIRIVNITSRDGSALKGSIRVRTATSKGELD